MRSAPRGGTRGFTRAFVSVRKLIAAICHGRWRLFDAAGVRGRPMTSWPSLQVHLDNTDAEGVDEQIAERRHERHASAAPA